MSLIQTTRIHRKKTQNTDTRESNTHDRVSTEETDRKTLLQHCGNIEKRIKIYHIYIQECAVITTTQ